MPHSVGRDDPHAGADHPNVLGQGGEDFYTLREYVVGDDLRRVHWASTARRGELMVRQDEVPWQGRATVLLDARRDTTSRRVLRACGVGGGEHRHRVVPPSGPRTAHHHRWHRLGVRRRPRASGPGDGTARGRPPQPVGEPAPDPPHAETRGGRRPARHPRQPDGRRHRRAGQSSEAGSGWSRSSCSSNRVGIRPGAPSSSHRALVPAPAAPGVRVLRITAQDPFVNVWNQAVTRPASTGSRVPDLRPGAGSDEHDRGNDRATGPGIAARGLQLPPVVVAEVALASLTVATIAGFSRLYQGASFFLPLATLAVAGHGLAATCRRRRLALPVVAVIAVVAGAVLIVWLFFGRTTVLGMPTLHTIDVADAAAAPARGPGSASWWRRRPRCPASSSSRPRRSGPACGLRTGPHFACGRRQSRSRRRPSCSSSARCSALRDTASVPRSCSPRRCWPSCWCTASPVRKASVPGSPRRQARARRAVAPSRSRARRDRAPRRSDPRTPHARRGPQGHRALAAGVRPQRLSHHGQPPGRHPQATREPIERGGLQRPVQPTVVLAPHLPRHLRRPHLVVRRFLRPGPRIAVIGPWRGPPAPPDHPGVRDRRAKRHLGACRVRGNRGRSGRHADAMGSRFVDVDRRRQPATSNGFNYTVVSDLPQFTAASLRRSGDSIPGKHPPDRLELPGDFNRQAARLARSVTASGHDPDDRALLLQTVVRDNVHLRPEGARRSQRGRDRRVPGESAGLLRAVRRHVRGDGAVDRPAVAGGGRLHAR